MSVNLLSCSRLLPNMMLGALFCFSFRLMTASHGCYRGLAPLFLYFIYIPVATIRVRKEIVLETIRMRS